MYFPVIESTHLYAAEDANALMSDIGSYDFSKNNSAAPPRLKLSRGIKLSWDVVFKF